MQTEQKVTYQGHGPEEFAEQWGLVGSDSTDEDALFQSIREFLHQQTVILVTHESMNAAPLALSEVEGIMELRDGSMVPVSEDVKRGLTAKRAPTPKTSDVVKAERVADDVRKFLLALAKVDDRIGYLAPFFRGIAGIKHDASMMTVAAANIDRLWT